MGGLPKAVWVRVVSWFRRSFRTLAAYVFSALWSVIPLRIWADNFLTSLNPVASCSPAGLGLGLGDRLFNGVDLQ